MTCLDASGLALRPPAKITIDKGAGTVGSGRVTPEEYYSIAVVELEHALAHKGHGA